MVVVDIVALLCQTRLMDTLRRFEVLTSVCSRMFGTSQLLEAMENVVLRAGSAVPFDARGIHRGLKFPGEVRRSLFIVYGTGEEVRHSPISDWAREPDYAQEQYLGALPEAFRRAAERTIELLKGD